MKIRLFPLAIIGAIFSCVLVFFLFRNNVTYNWPVSKRVLEKNSNETPAPTPFPFQDLTIEYLRSRQYLSRLNDLNPLSENNLYTAYTASYDSDGLKIYGYLTKPKGEMPSGGWPGIIFIHGYIPPSVYKTSQNYVSYVDYLAKNGFVVYKIDLRGHDRSEGEASGAYFSGDYIIDTLNAGAALAASGFVNPDKIGLWGHSMGGNVVFRSFVTSPDIKAAVIWAGAVFTYADMREFGINDNSYRPPTDTSVRQSRRNELRALYGDYTDESWFWKLVNPTNYLDGINRAIQIHHATDDQVVSINYSRNLMQILNGSSVPHELYEYSSGGHNLTDPAFTRAMQRSVEFYKEHLK